MAQNLEEDIYNQLNAGFTKEEIRSNLITNGVPTEEIDKTFETINFNYTPASVGSGSSTKSIIITIIFLLITTFKVIRCISRNDDRTRYNTQQQFDHSVNDNLYQAKNAQVNREIANLNSQKFIYKDYQQLENISSAELKAYKIQKVTNDSLIVFDLGSKINIKAGTYYLNNYSNKLRMGLKTKNNTNIFIYDFEVSADGLLLDEFKYAKAGMTIENAKTDKLVSMKTIKYNLTVNDLQYNGFALISKENNRFLCFAFENDKLSKNKLQGEAIKFFENNFKINKG